MGLASAYRILERFPKARLILIEKEAALACHQTGHNSGVIHSGLYYRPGSFKARLCVSGAKQLIAFCRQHELPHDLCGKLVVAVQPDELARLQMLYERGLANGVEGLRIVEQAAIKDFEPHARGLKALHVPTTGLVDFGAVSRCLASQVAKKGGQIMLSTRLLHIQENSGGWILETTRGAVQTDMLIGCAGLYSDRLSAKAGSKRDVQIIPFRGEYYDVVASKSYLVRSMVYPVPDPSLPFLGVHFTKTLGGGLHAGPNAVLAFKREGYRKRDVYLPDMLEYLAFPGFWRMSYRFWRAGLAESYRSFSKNAFVKALKRLVPEVEAGDLIPGGSGVRAQAVDRAGNLLDDFDLVEQKQAIHVRNAPSPAATSSLAIGSHIVDLLSSRKRPWMQDVSEHAWKG